MKKIVSSVIALSAACAAAPDPARAVPERATAEPAETVPAETVQLRLDLSRANELPVPLESATIPVWRSTPVAGLPSRRDVPARAAGQLGVDGATASLRAQLDATRMRSMVVRDEESLRAVVDLVRDATGLPLVVTPGAEQAALDEGVVFDFELKNAISVKNLLNLIKRQTNGSVIWKIRHEAVILTTADKAAETTALVTHDIRALTMVRTDFLAPRIDRLRLLDELEDDDGGGPFGGIGEQARQMEEEDVAALVQENIAPDSWEQDGVSIEAANGFLFVRHTPDVQRRVARFLESLGGP